MYHINHSEDVDNLNKSARDIQTKMNSSAMITTEEKLNIFAESLTIHENTPIDQLKDLDNSIVMYSKKWRAWRNYSYL